MVVQQSGRSGEVIAALGQRVRQAMVSCIERIPRRDAQLVFRPSQNPTRGAWAVSAISMLNVWIVI